MEFSQTLHIIRLLKYSKSSNYKPHSPSMLSLSNIHTLASLSCPRLLRQVGWSTLDQTTDCSTYWATATPRCSLSLCFSFLFLCTLFSLLFASPPHKHYQILWCWCHTRPPYAFSLLQFLVFKCQTLISIYVQYFNRFGHCFLFTGNNKMLTDL